MLKEGEKIDSATSYEEVFKKATNDVFREIKNDFYDKIPSTWDFIIKSKVISFEEIRSKMLECGYSVETINKYYGEDCRIETDSFIIELTINNGNKVINKPLFIAEGKKQGTNDKRVAEGKEKQSQGNAIERTAKNYIIVSDYCYCCDKDFFPYVIFVFGCDFGEDITKTIKSKLCPYVGKLNVLNPFFDKDIPGTHKGGSCFYQKEMFTYNQFYEICYKTCEIGINFYLKKYGYENNHDALEMKLCEAVTS